MTQMSGKVVDLELYKSQRPAAAFAAQMPSGDDAESLADGIGASFGIIRYKRGVWSLSYRGENRIFLRPEDGTPVGYLDVVILRQARVKAKSFYGIGNKYDEAQSAGKRPICASIDGVRPDSDVQQKQSEVCGLCPHNEFRTKSDGKKGRDCSDYKRLAVLIMPEQTTRLLGRPLMEPVFLRVPPDSLQDLAVFGKNLEAQNWPYMSFITRITFDPEKSHPKFVFNFHKALTDQDAPTIFALREDALSKRITGEDEIALRAGLPAPAATAPAATAPAATARTLPPSGGAPAGAFQQAAPQDALSVMQTAQSGPVGALGPALGPAPVLDAALGQGGSFNVAGVAGVAGVTAAVTEKPIQLGAAIGQTAEDVGDTVDDADLDARIKALMTIG
jgi:hypothetical protein